MLLSAYSNMGKVSARLPSSPLMRSVASALMSGFFFQFGHLSVADKLWTFFYSELLATRFPDFASEPRVSVADCRLGDTV